MNEGSQVQYQTNYTVLGRFTEKTIPRYCKSIKWQTRNKLLEDNFKSFYSSFGFWHFYQNIRCRRGESHQSSLTLDFSALQCVVHLTRSMHIYMSLGENAKSNQKNKKIAYSVWKWLVWMKWRVQRLTSEMKCVHKIKNNPTIRKSIEIKRTKTGSTKQG